MIDQNDIKEPPSTTHPGNDVFKKTQNGDVLRHPKLQSTEIKIITGDDLDSIEQEWNDLARESDTHIFQTFDWNRIWWKHFGANKNLHIVAVYSRNKLIGIAPFFEDNVTLLGRNVYRSLRLLGSYVSQPKGEPLIGSISYSDYLDCIVKPGSENIFYPLLLHHFNEIRSSFDEIVLDEISEESGINNSMIPLMAKSKYRLSYKTEQASSSPVIQLNSTWDGYLDSMSVKDRYNARRYYKRSKKGKKKTFNIEQIKQANELPGVLSDLFQMHQKQWNNRGFPGTFSEIRMRNFFTEITRSFIEKGWIQFDMAVPVEVNHKSVAIDVFLTYKNRVYLMHRGMDEDPQYRKQGPGNVLLYARLENAINDGVKVFDMLRGTEDFKLRLATKINQNKNICISFDHKSGEWQPGLVKKYLKLIRNVRSEVTHLKVAFSDNSFFNGITDYVKFMQYRIKHKLDL